MVAERRKINWSLSFTSEKIVHTNLHKKDSDESQLTVAFESEDFAVFCLDIMIVKDIYQEGKVQQIVNSRK